MSTKTSDFIASEQLGEVDDWRLPDMGDGASILAQRQQSAYGRYPQHRKQQSTEIIEDVAQESVELKPMTAQELQELTQEAERDGFAKGHSEGLEQGREAGHREGFDKGLADAKTEANQILSRQVDQLMQIAESLLNPIGEQDQQLEHLVLDTVKELTRQLVKRELQTDSTQVLEAVRTAIDALPVGQDHVSIYLAKEDLALVEAYCAELGRDCAIKVDDSLTPGGCRVETAKSRVDYSIASRLHNLFDQFEQRQLASESLDEEKAKSGDASPSPPPQEDSEGEPRP